MVENIEDDKDIKNTPAENVEVRHTDAAQTGLEHLMAQTPVPLDDMGQPIVQDTGTSLLESEGVGAANINPIFMQPNYEGKFEFSKKEFINTIIADKIIEQNIAYDLSQDSLTSGLANNSEFAQQNFGNNLQNLAGSDLEFNKIYFGDAAHGTGFEGKGDVIENFTGSPFGPSLAPGAQESSAGQIATGTVIADSREATGVVAPTDQQDAANITEITNLPIDSTSNNTGPITPPTIVTPPEMLVPIVPATPEQPTNHAPIARSMNLSMAMNGSLLIYESSVLSRTYDRDGDVLTITRMSSDSGSLINNNNGTWTFTPNQDFHGRVDLAYTVSDGQLAASENINVYVLAPNSAPVVPEVNYTLAEDNTLIITSTDLLANAADIDGNTLGVTNVYTNQGTIVNNNNGTWSFTPNHDFNGVVVLGFTVTDFHGSIVNQSINVNVTPVNDAPILTPTSYTIAEDNVLIITAADLLTHANDVDSSNLSIASVSVASGQGSLVNMGNGTWQFTPNSNFNGNLQLNYSVTDGIAITPSTINVVVTPVNDAPVSSAANYSMGIDGTLVIRANDLLTHASDIDSTNLTITSVSVPAGQGTLVDNHDGTWSFTPNLNFQGQVQLSYTVSDGSLSSLSPINITVSAGNVPPIATPVSYTIAEDNTLLIRESDLLSHASDADSANLTVASVTVPAGQGTLVNNNNGTWSFTPNLDFSGN